VVKRKLEIANSKSLYCIVLNLLNVSDLKVFNCNEVTIKLLSFILIC
jgi:hypothetical protein